MHKLPPQTAQTQQGQQPAAVAKRPDIGKLPAADRVLVKPAMPPATAPAAQHSPGSHGRGNLQGPASRQAGTAHAAGPQQWPTASRQVPTSSTDGSVIDLATTPNAVAAVSASGTGQAGAEDISSASPAGKSAFAVMLKAASTRTGNAQRPVAAPVGGTGPPGRAAGMAGGGWQDELRKVALDPERWARRLLDTACSRSRLACRLRCGSHAQLCRECTLLVPRTAPCAWCDMRMRAAHCMSRFH